MAAAPNLDGQISSFESLKGHGENTCFHPAWAHLLATWVLSAMSQALVEAMNDFTKITYQRTLLMEPLTECYR